MKIILEFMKNNKKTIIVSTCVGLSIIIFIMGFMFLFGKETKELELKKTLEDMGRDFYENYYYDSIKPTPEERKERLKAYEKLGIKIDLNNLSRFNSEKNKKLIEEFINPKTKEPCDLTETKVTIFPKDSFEKEDYDIEVTLKCDFIDEEKGAK